MSKFIFLVDGEMLSESLHFTTGLLSSLGAQIVLSSEELLNEAVIEVYSTAQKVEGVNVVSALRRVYTGSITSRLPDFLSLKLSSLPQHPNTSQRLGRMIIQIISTAEISNLNSVQCFPHSPLPQDACQRICPWILHLHPGNHL